MSVGSQNIGVIQLGQCKHYTWPSLPVMSSNNEARTVYSLFSCDIIQPLGLKPEPQAQKVLL